MNSTWSKKYTAFALLIPIFTFGFGLSAGYQYGTEQSIDFEPLQIIDIKEDKAPYSLDLYWNIYNILEQKYLFHNKLEEKENLIFSSVKGLVDGLEDPYTKFMTPQESKDFEDSLSGHLQGIGAIIASEKENLVVVSPIAGSPADEADLRSGDIVIAIDGEPSSKFDFFEAIKTIRGKPGTTVTLTVKRGDPIEVIDIEIVREDLNIPSVIKGDVLDENIHVIKITQFGENTNSEFKKILSSTLLEKPEGIVLDLRNNGGGILDQAIDVISEFADNEVVTRIESRITDSSEETKKNGRRTKPGGSAIGIPVVVWVNQGSASASEIVAAFFKETGRGQVIGETTFGKGTVQELVSLQNGSSIRVTTARWLTPSGNFIDEVGVTPQIVIEGLNDLSREEIDDKFIDETISYFEEIQ